MLCEFGEGTFTGSSFEFFGHYFIGTPERI